MRKAQDADTIGLCGMQPLTDQGCNTRLIC